MHSLFMIPCSRRLFIDIILCLYIAENTVWLVDLYLMLWLSAKQPCWTLSSPAVPSKVQSETLLESYKCIKRHRRLITFCSSQSRSCRFTFLLEYLIKINLRKKWGFLRCYFDDCFLSADQNKIVYPCLQCRTWMMLSVMKLWTLNKVHYMAKGHSWMRALL